MVSKLLQSLCVLLALAQGGLGIQSEEEKLLDNLFEGYNPSARPVINSSNTVNVEIMFSLLQIQDLVSTNSYIIQYSLYSACHC